MKSTPKKKKSISIIAATSSSNPEYSADCEFGVFVVDDDLVASLRRRERLVRSIHRDDAAVYAVNFWGSSCEFVAYSEVAAIRGIDTIDDTNWMSLPSQPVVDEYQRVECRQTILRIGTNGEIELAFDAMPKHSDITVTTREIPLSELFSLWMRSNKRRRR